MSTIVLTGGGTAGHVMPALALVPYLRAYFSHICYAGASGGVEEKLAARHDLPFFGTETIKFDRLHLLRDLSIPRVLRRASRAVAAWLSDIHCNVVFSKGGYCALPTVLAAARLGIPIVCHESDRTLGLANRLSLHYTPYLITSFDTISRGVYLGNPIRDAVFEGSAERVPLARHSAFTVLVMGGSMGAKVLNEYAVRLAESRPLWNIVNLYGRSPVACARSNYMGIAFAENIADYYACADVVVCRAGANTLFELSALSKPTVTIPLPKGSTSRGDQQQNAAYFAEKYGFVTLEQSSLTIEALQDAIVKAREAKPSAVGRVMRPNASIARYVYDVYRHSQASL